MDPRKAIFLLLALVSAMAFFASDAHALAMTSSASGRFGVDALYSPAGKSAIRQLHAAVRGLEQAALQTNFASNSEELRLLQSAHQRLIDAAKSLCGAQRARTLRVAADIARVIARDDARLGPLVSPDGDSFGPPAPSPNQLAQLVAESRDLLRNGPIWHEFLDADAIKVQTLNADDLRQPERKDSVDMAIAGPMAWPPSILELPTQPYFGF